MIAETVVDTTALLSNLLTLVGLAQPPAGEVHITGRDPIWDARYPIGEVAPDTLIALGRRARAGGSYHVRASLCQPGM